MASSFFLSALLLVSSAHARIPTEPICEMNKIQNEQLRKYVADLKARSGGIAGHPDQPRMKTIIQRQLKCLEDFTKGPERFCDGIKASEGQRPDDQARRMEQKVSEEVADDPRCGYFRAMASIENESWYKVYNEMKYLENLLPAFQKCSKPVGPALANALGDIKNPDHMNAYVESMGKVTEFQDTVDYTPELKNEIARLKTHSTEFGKSHGILKQKHKDCLPKNVPTMRFR